jgi:hypothetical protein
VITLAARSAATLSAAVLFALALPPALAATAPASHSVPIGHRQFFEGLVNSRSEHAALHVACAGPASTGTVRKGQTVKVDMAVTPTASGQGYTGTAARRIRAWLTWPTAVAAGTPVHVATFTSYDVAMRIPARLKVPCSGTGRMVFVPAPGSHSARRAVVKVTFKSNGA